MLSTFHYPPFNRFVPWREDSDYRVAIVSPVGLGPKGEKGDPLMFDDLTSNDIAKLTEIALQQGFAEGPQGKSAYEVARDVAEENDDLDNFPATEEEWIASLKGEPGEDGVDGQDGNDGSFDQMSQEQINYFCDYLQTQVARRLTSISVIQYTKRFTSENVNAVVEDNHVVEINLTDLFSGAGFTPSDLDTYFIVVNGLMLCPPDGDNNYGDWHFTTAENKLFAVLGSDDLIPADSDTDIFITVITGRFNTVSPST